MFARLSHTHRHNLTLDFRWSPNLAFGENVTWGFGGAIYLGFPVTGAN